MKKVLIFILLGIVIYSCNNQSNQKNSDSEQTIDKVKKESREFPNDDVTKNQSFIELVSYNYQDSEDYGKSIDNRTLKIIGKTNLPEKTSIKIDIGGFVPSTKEEDASDTYGNAEVHNGEFKIDLKPWNIPESITFRVFKDDQPNQVLKIIGESGDKMIIAEENKAEFSSICFYKKTVNINGELITSRKNGKSIKYTFQSANDLKSPEEKALAKFINAWKNKNWNEMLTYTQSSQNETKESLENMFGNTEVIGFEIISKKKNPDEYVKNWYSIKYKVNIKPMISHKGIQEKIITANVINENGKWGVNATSATGGLYQ
jgi:hypothetical protein